MMHRLLTSFGLILSLIWLQLSPLSAVAEIYKTIDKNGRVIYTDVPPPNDKDAKPLDLKSINSLPSPAASNAPASNNNTQAPLEYVVQILEPANGTTLMPDERSVNVSISLNQSLQEGDLLAYKLDGNTLEKTTDLTASLNEPPRGEHHLTVEVIDSDGTSLAQSNSITIEVMRPLPKQQTTTVPAK